MARLAVGAVTVARSTVRRWPGSRISLPPLAYLRLLFARIGVPHDPETGERLIRQILQQIVDHGRGHPVSGAGPGGAGAARAPTTPGDEH